MGDFLSALGDQINKQLSLGENNANSQPLDKVIDGNFTSYGNLGEFANKFDRSAERKYVEQGYLRNDPYGLEAKNFEIYMQEPSATVLVKKRMFSSVAENFRPDYMDSQEKLYYRTIKVLFDNKCNQISSLERLSKIQKVTEASGTVSDELMPVILTLWDSIVSGTDQTTSLFGLFSKSTEKFSDTLNQIRKIYSYNKTSKYTQWIADSSSVLQSKFGRGTGVIELTNFTNIETNVSCDSINNMGNCNFGIVDPYESMLITEWDIEKAIADSTNLFKNSNFYQLIGQGTAQELIRDKQDMLNQMRKQRGASAISIKIDSDTLVGRKVRAIIDDVGLEIAFDYNSVLGTGGFTKNNNAVDVDDQYIYNPNVKEDTIAGPNGLNNKNVIARASGITSYNTKAVVSNTTELEVFKSLIVNIYNKLDVETNSRNAFLINNDFTNYIRRKLRFNFLGKLIIQPMDTVHVYMKSKGQFDNKIIGGLKDSFNGYTLLKSLDAVSNQFQQVSSLFYPSRSVEKAAFVGEDFSDFFWSMMRPQFVNENEGVHVFAGIVKNASSSWSNGQFSVSVRCDDNTAYFDQGKVNFKPGVDVFNGAIYDPLTPFKSNFDTISTNAKDQFREPLAENKVLLGTAEAPGFLKYKSGVNTGKKVDYESIDKEAYIDKNTGGITRVFHAPDGLVYKWKEGIGVFTQFGSSLELSDPNKVGNPNTFEDPLAGQDVMNAISLLVTGKPYNYASFWRNVYTLYGYDKSTHTQQDAAHSYVNFIQNELEKRNTLWGNFLPFKQITIDAKAFAEAQKSQYNLNEQNTNLTKKINELQELDSQAAIVQAKNILDPNSSATVTGSTLDGKRTSLDKEIQSALKQIETEENNFNAQASKAGFDATYDFNTFTGSASNSDSKAVDARKELRKKINFLTRRMSYNVRANEDRNLFIVDDSYDKDYDIIAFNKSLADGIKLYSNDYLSVRDKIRVAADLLNLEVYADTQGHIRVRSPQYNKMPSSIFYRMMHLKRNYNIQIFPDFINNLFKDQLSGLISKLEILEDYIRLDSAILLGLGDSRTANITAQAKDQEISKFINKDIANNAENFQFITNDNGKVIEYEKIINSANPKENEETINSLLINAAISKSNKDVFRNSVRYKIIYDALKQQSNGVTNSQYSVSNQIEYQNNLYLDSIASRISSKSGISVQKRDYLIVSGFTSVVAETNARIDIFKVTQELQDKLRERQLIIKQLYGCLKNLRDYKTLDNGKITNYLLAPSLYKNEEIPEILENMIEDESYDDLGPGSGSRYIIKRSQLISVSISENEPDFTAVSVQGTLNPFAPNSLPDLNSFPDGGNGMTTAMAIDYDMWRNYGFKNVSTIKVPFLSDPITQCGPYATMILSRARKNILRGDITIAGNEYIQPGEVIYLEDRGLLFYVNKVSHSFTFGSDFKTTLSLSYGHSPGEYIPTTLDIIGKILFNNRDIGGYVIQRQSSSGNQISLGVLQKDPDSTIEKSMPNTGNNSKKSDSNTNSFINANLRVLNNILNNAAYIIRQNNSKGINVRGKVELRIYHDNSNDTNFDLLEMAGIAKGFLSGQGGLGSDTTSPSNNSQFKPTTFTDKDISIQEINLDDPNDPRSPSQFAMDSARNLSEKNKNTIKITAPVKIEGNKESPVTGDSLDGIKASLFGYIVDCWVIFEDLNSVITK